MQLGVVLSDGGGGWTRQVEDRLQERAAITGRERQFSRIAYVTLPMSIGCLREDVWARAWAWPAVVGREQDGALWLWQVIPV